jgi:G3E family GTPase
MTELGTDPRTPVTLLTGWLGAGKTTLLNRILAEPQGHRFAVLVNEFGEIGVDDRLVMRSNDDVVELNNGCVCCTVRGDLVRTLKNLRLRKPPFFRRRKFDRILIETTGIAEPAPLLRTFLVEEDIAIFYQVEAVIGMVDAHSLESALSENSAVEQIALADLLLLNKTDLATPKQTVQARQRLQKINPAAPIRECQHAQVPVPEILQARPPRGLADLETHIHSKAGGPNHAHTNLQALSLREEHPLDEMKVQLWLDGIATMLEGQLVRYKGFLDLHDRSNRGILQGVYELYTVEAGQKWAEDELRCTEIVFIGRNLDLDYLSRGLQACRANC